MECVWSAECILPVGIKVKEANATDGWIADGGLRVEVDVAVGIK